MRSMTVADNASCDEFLKNPDQAKFYHYYDNTGKFGAHFFEGFNSLWLGDVKGCIGDGKSRYCVWDFFANKENETIGHKVLWGICLPLFCHREDINNKLSDMLSALKPVSLKPGSTFRLSCLDQTDVSSGYYVISTLLLILLLLCLLSTAVVHRYETNAKMNYSFVYKYGPKNLGVVRPSVRKRRELGISTIESMEDEEERRENPHSNPSVEALMDGHDEEENLRNGDEARMHLIREERPRHKARSKRDLGTTSTILEPSGGFVEERSDRASPSDDPGGRKDHHGTFGPPSEELLEKAFKYRPGPVTKVCYNFCLRTNLSKVTDRAKNRLRGLDCIRVVSFLFLLFVQSFIYAMKYGIIANASLKKEVIRKYFLTYALTCYPLALDALFFVSGFLSILNRRIKKWKDLVTFLIRRYLRLYVPLLFVLLVQIFLTPHWFSLSGSLAYHFEMVAENCSHVWLKMTFGIQNFLIGEECDNFEWCLSWSWMVASLWQQSLFLTLIFFYTKGKVFFFCHILLISTSLISVALLIMFLDLKPDFIGSIGISEYLRDLQQYKDLILTKPYSYITPYSLGVLLSYMLQRKGQFTKINDNNLSNVMNANVDMNANNNIENGTGLCRTFKSRFSQFCSQKGLLWLGWIGCLIVLVGFFGLQYTILTVGSIGKTGNGLYGTIFHLLWPLVLSWVTYNGFCGRGGIFIWFSSWKVWTHLGQLTYSAILVHGICLMYICSSWTTVINPGNGFSMFILYSSALVLSWAFSIVVYLLVEAPLLNLLAPSAKE